MRFDGKVALVTGAAVGIGRASAIRLAQNGARVVLIDVNEEKLEAARREIEAITSDVISFVCDVCDEKKVYDTVKEIESSFGRVDILVNNAALWRC